MNASLFTFPIPEHDAPATTAQKIARKKLELHALGRDLAEELIAATEAVAIIAASVVAADALPQAPGVREIAVRLARDSRTDTLNLQSLAGRQ